MSEHLARAWAIARQDGMVLGFTDHDQVLNFEGITFRPESGLTARAVVQGLGLSVDNSEAIGALSDAAITETDLLAGRWDGADVRLWEVDWTRPAQRRLVFRGQLGEITHSNGAFRAELRGLSEPLNRAQGRVYHSRCSAALGDGQCGFDTGREGYSAHGVIQQLTQDQTLVLASVPGHDAGWFKDGQITILSGAAAGLKAMVRSDEPLPGGRRRLVLWAGLGVAPAAGDRVRLIAGCDKRAQTCRMKFQNYLNFRGFPHLPPEDWLMAPQVNR
ncbi:MULTISPECIES: DUF2163 domain-containing protein [unclassified Paracoccus (in: a-proteobacteria)]|uniref:DUF2163 domain-containing protein n=1 Tax=unclassified Paracoccus (in: a-proteobacteria) TaxID=2688777 RepID=UPI0012B3D04E|nr:MULTISPECIES: DUF2163 domain-containing protein [unclassified Paracoccus (in: a-proteobacteria)]UXU74970.1 DUF2163 domain-containing protein [Paracoccus sp. SMMA_5]UXU80873.1 DUF2163 domain-containing protein [Paracoccus sp. SMMA_5_TC]